MVGVVVRRSLIGATASGGRRSRALTRSFDTLLVIVNSQGSSGPAAGSKDAQDRQARVERLLHRLLGQMGSDHDASEHGPGGARVQSVGHQQGLHRFRAGRIRRIGSSS